MYYELSSLWPTLWKYFIIKKKHKKSLVSKQGAFISTQSSVAGWKSSIVLGFTGWYFPDHLHAFEMDNWLTMSGFRVPTMKLCSSYLCYAFVIFCRVLCYPRYFPLISIKRKKGNMQGFLTFNHNQDIVQLSFNWPKQIIWLTYFWEHKFTW